jgi:acyl transferase domain-containing protein
MEESITVAYYRGVALKARTLGGGMAAIGLGAEEVGQLLSDALSIACVNSGTSVTISGDGRLLDQFIENLKTDRPEVFARRLHVEMAYHSRMLLIFADQV